MIIENFADLASAAKGRILRGAPEIIINGHFTDTRSPVRGGLYVALRGERFDGNLFAREAVERHGAAAVLVDNAQAADALPEYAGAILVDDARLAYLGIAAAHRQKLSKCLWLAVTGSVGKSTTKELLAHILKAAKPKRKIHKAQGSFNNEVGLSKTILETSADTDAAVLELGTNHPGEIERLAAVARPNIAILTCAAESHLEAFGCVANVAREKSAILNFQEPQDTAVLNADDAHFELWKAAARGKILSYGLSESATLRALNVELDTDGCARFAVKLRKRITHCALAIPGAHQVSNALAAIGAAFVSGVSLEDAAAAAGTFAGVARRFATHRIKGVTLIDDAYNASPTSFKAALDTLKSIRVERRFVIAGGMLELGEQSAARHRELGASLAKMNLSGLTVVGELAKDIGAGALAHGFDTFALNFLDTPEAAADTLGQILYPGDALLVKGSHGIHLERCVERLLAKLNSK